uniref:Putative Fis-like DNA-binding protein n=1 Tax=Candidatus Kentrum sp. TUN TaxID=2126343 RepID=A0A450ZNW3_9GAMM|nr:MAG: Fis family transcriptional regulator, factor for inversion stimulation protein [Candidatus Kentron sp. TUN]VFK55482.1 MAG: Fis family transcriptional regulator, factor for inversion stimulation protein [Candidatus Kentron sp. TUN]VFK63839.1 MAG: Fis family transcriptional regulator, factor for inversion stimulation protein [Candidatus Kentron sp. TUN]
MTLAGEERGEANDHVQECDNKKPQPLHECVRNAIENYFLQLDGHAPSFGLYKMVINEVEAPLLKVVLQQARGNYSRAAELLGINRATLRKKLKQLQITG